jgi:A/G-specific adenine glycosylase
MPWREPEPDGTFDAYKIMVSEIMLQQTQVARVIPKYKAFLARFPDVQTLAEAPLADVLSMWQGLGYNRRAKFLWEAARMVAADYKGTMPATITELVSLPGIGVNTAGAICAYAYNEPVIFIETNIRTVLIHYHFKDHVMVADKQLLPLLEQALAWWQKYSGHGSREFYWALMDYGTYLKVTEGNASRKSKAYAKQSIFKGSKRQVRGTVIRALSAGPMPAAELQEIIQDPRLVAVCEDLMREGLISRNNDALSLG